MYDSFKDTQHSVWLKYISKNFANFQMPRFFFVTIRQMLSQIASNIFADVHARNSTVKVKDTYTILIRQRVEEVLRGVCGGPTGRISQSITASCLGVHLVRQAPCFGPTGLPTEPWWRHQMETFSALLALSERNPPVTGGFPSQRSVTRSFDVFFDLPAQTVEQAIETPVILDALILTSLQWQYQRQRGSIITQVNFLQSLTKETL